MSTTMQRSAEFCQTLEGMLASILFVMKPLSSSDADDKQSYLVARDILNGFAARYGLRPPDELCNQPLALQDEWYWPDELAPCRFLLDTFTVLEDHLGSAEAVSMIDAQELRKLLRAMLHVLGRYEILTYHPQDIGLCNTGACFQLRNRTSYYQKTLAEVMAA